MLRPSSRTRARLVAGAAVAVLMLAACGDDDDDDDTAATDAAPATEAAIDAAPVTEAPSATEPAGTEPAGTDAAEPAGEGATVALAASDLGEILVNGDGMTLYMFVPDAQGAPTCTGGCLEAWPLVPGPATADGVDESLLATAEHPEGGTQATCNSWPLYTFASDTAPGDVTGQGASDNWFVLDATCTPVEG